MSQPSELLIPPGQEPLLRRMLAPQALPDGWSFVAAAATGSKVHGLYQHLPDGTRACVTLVHPSGAPGGSSMTQRFGASLQSSGDLPSLRELFTAVEESVRAAEEEFTWAQPPPPVVRPPEAESQLSADAPTQGTGGESTPRGESTPGAPAPAEHSPDYPRLEPELDRHLEYVSYVDLGVCFDPAPCLAEALALLDRFVVYQSDNYGVEGWRSLALRALHGNAAGAALPGDTPNNEPENYRPTEIAALCPKTMAVLSELLDLEQCRVVTFLLLEPGARIAVHVDDGQRMVFRSINVALNMPPGCEFHSETNPDGSATPFTRTAPFVSGGVLLMNVARYHWVANPSSEPRIHVIARGPLRTPAAELLALARRQNGLETPEALEAALAEKYRHPEAMTGTAEAWTPGWLAARQPAPTEGSPQT